MDVDIAMHLEWYVNYARENNYVLGEHAKNIIRMVMKNDGKCPCKKDSDQDETCPCPDHKEEIENNGHCKCNLFLKGE